MFSKFERLTAWRYLRAKRKEGFISVITGFAFTGIALGVATLIIVMSVMNGFKAELLNRILGINGHISIVSSAGFPFNNYKKAVKDLESIEDTTKRQIDIAKECYEKLDNLQILIIENKTDLEFITSDNPIVIGNEFQNEYGLGMDCIGICFLFPISLYLFI